MKKMMFFAVCMFTSGLYAQTTNSDKYSKAILESLCIDQKGLSSSYNDIFQPNLDEMDKLKKEIVDKDTGEIKEGYLASVANCAGYLNTQSKDCDFSKAGKVLKVDARLKMSLDYEKDMTTKIDEAEKKSGTYLKDKEIKVATHGYRVGKDLIGERLDLAEAEKAYVKIKNKNALSLFVKSERMSPSKMNQEEQKALANIKSKEEKYKQSLSNLATEKFDVNENDADGIDETDYEMTRNKIVEAVTAVEEDLKVSVTKVSDNEIFTSIPEGMEFCKGYDKLKAEEKKKCDELAGKYLAAVASGSDVWKPIKITSDENCDFFTKMGPKFWQTAIGYFSLYKTLDLQRCISDYGLGDDKCIGKATTLKNYGNDTFGLTDPLYKEDLMGSAGAGTRINPNLPLVGGGSSLALGGTQPFNPYSAFTNNQTPLAIDPLTGTSAVGGSGNRLNSNQASNLFSNYSKQYVAAGTGASNFSNKYSNYSTELSSYNNNLQSNIAPVSSPLYKVYNDRAKSVSNTIKDASGEGARYPKSSQGYTSTIDLRLKIAALNAEKKELANSFMDIVAQGRSNEFNLKFGNLEEKKKAAAGMAMTKGYVDYVRAKISAIDSEIALYYKNTNMIINRQNSVVENDTSSMYAANNNAVYVKRAVKLKDLKTPVVVSYILKDGWRENFEKYVADMAKKAEESKRQLNEAKSKLQKLLSQKVPIVPLSKLPSLTRTAYEIKNMDTLKFTAIRNMQSIDKAMAYHQARKRDMPSGVYAKYEKEAETLKTSMQGMVQAIDQHKKPIEKSYALLKDIYTETPKSEELRRVAKEMVSRGL